MGFPAPSSALRATFPPGRRTLPVHIAIGFDGPGPT